MNGLFFELLQVAIGNRKTLTRPLTDDEWASMYGICEKQALLGIAFAGVERLPKEQCPPFEVLAEWVHDAQVAKERNEKTFVVCEKLVNYFKDNGFNACILKGQSNLCYYPDNLKCSRTSGDVDVWLKPKDKSNRHPVKSVMDFLENKGLILSLCYLHAEIKPVAEIAVEVHFRPSFLNCPWRNRYFLNVFTGEECINSGKDGGVLPKLWVDYDVIFQLNHLYRHLLDEGIGLRQVLDYYMLLKAYHDEKPESILGKEHIMNRIRKCGMERFVSAMMWLLCFVFDMPKEWMICKPSEKDGRFLLDEIMQAGNFGHYDSRMVELEVKKGDTSYQVRRALRRIKRNFRFFTSYPLEVIFEPYARLTHFWWRKFRLWRF